MLIFCKFYYYLKRSRDTFERELVSYLRNDIELLYLKMQIFFRILKWEKNYVWNHTSEWFGLGSCRFYRILILSFLSISDPRSLH